jgi:hypothetical protein
MAKAPGYLRCEAFEDVALVFERAWGESLCEISLSRPIIPNP